MSRKIYLSIPLLLISLSFIQFSASTVIGFDFGSEFLKASTIQPGKLFSIVEDTTTKRKTPSSVGFCANDRVFEWDIIAKRPKCYQNTFWNLPKFIGKIHNDSHLLELSKNYLEDYKIIENEDGTISFGIKPFKFGEDDTITEVTVENLVAMLFKHVKILAEKQAERQLKDIVVTIPPWWGFRERIALHDALVIADLNPLAFVHENTAAALYYALEREDNTTFTVIFYNIGSGGLKVSLVEFKLENSTEKYEKNKQHEGFRVLAEAWDDSVSGVAIDANLVKHFAKVFDALPARQGKKSILTSYPAIAKLYKEASKVKEILSANKQVNIYMEGLFDSTDFKYLVDRPLFDEINADIYAKLTKPVEEVLVKAQKNIDEIDEFEIIGGVVRIPKIQQILTDYMRGKPVSAHLNGDESMALGAAFYAANFSSSFKTRPIYSSDGYNFDIRVEVHDLVPAPEGETPLEKAAVLFPFKTRYGTKRNLAFHHTRDFEATFYAAVNNNPESWIYRYEVTGVNEISENPKYKDLGAPKVSLMFHLNPLGFVELTKAEAYIEETIIVEEKVNATKTNKTKTEKSKTTTSDEPKEETTQEKKAEETEEAEAKPEETQEQKEEAQKNEETQQNTEETPKSEEAKNEEATEEAKTEEAKTEEAPKAEEGETKTENAKEAEPELPKNHKKKVITHTIHLTVKKIIPEPLSMSEDEIEAGRALLTKFETYEMEKHRLSESKNRLESFIYKSRELLEDERFIEASKEEERTKLQQLSEENGEWLNGDEAYTAKYKEFDIKYKDMADIAEKVLKRIEQADKRPEAIKIARGALADFTKHLSEANKTRPWINETHTGPVFKQIQDAEEWLNEQITKQEGLAPNDDPAFTTTQIVAKLDRIKDAVNRVKSIQKPKDPKDKDTKGSKGKARPEGFNFGADGKFDEEAFKEYMRKNGNKFDEDMFKKAENNAGGNTEAGNEETQQGGNENHEDKAETRQQQEEQQQERTEESGKPRDDEL